jgi:hypothetical protein
VQLEFETGSGPKIFEPTSSQIAEELAALPGGIDSFAILSHDEMTYIQAAGGASERFLLEYQEGSIDQHYRSTSNDLSLSTVTEAFSLYASGDPSWKSLATWEREDLSQYSPAFPLLPMALIGAAILALIAWLWRAT